ncbi:MAG TPA: BamA/TamA family outer membrane protein [Candidatus Didemnitutus sp.]|nr:BamA/TamA family outer membrane protein [Candidatus Didemnitutus sp.]
MRTRSHVRLLLVFSAVLAFAGAARAQTAVDTTAAAGKPKPSFFDQFKDPDDGTFDMSQFILSKHGFLVVPIIITEPAVGYGGGAAVVFFDYAPDPPPGAPPPKRYAPPSLTAVVGGMTENGTWFGALAYRGIWRDDTLRYLGVVGRAHAVLKYYGNGGGGPGLDYKTDAWLVLQQLEQRLGDSNWFVGARYLYIGPDTTFTIGNSNVPGLKPIEFSSATAGLGAMVSYDSVNNMFTPTKGIRMETILSAFDDALGGDFSYGRLDYFNTFYWELVPKQLSMGLRLEGHFTLGDGKVPFYHQPSIDQRGVPAARFQGRQSAMTEVEIDWSVHPRWTLVVFGGDGRVSADSFSDLGDADDVFAYGVGFRYTIARKLGIKAGLDFAWSKDDSGIYITMGSAWVR